MNDYRRQSKLPVPTKPPTTSPAAPTAASTNKKSTYLPPRSSFQTFLDNDKKISAEKTSRKSKDESSKENKHASNVEE